MFTIKTGNQKSLKLALPIYQFWDMDLLISEGPLYQSVPVVSTYYISGVRLDALFSCEGVLRTRGHIHS